MKFAEKSLFSNVKHHVLPVGYLICIKIKGSLCILICLTQSLVCLILNHICIFVLQNFPLYGPDYELKIYPGNRKNKNDDCYIKDLLRMAEGEFFYLHWTVYSNNKMKQVCLLNFVCTSLKEKKSLLGGLKWTLYFMQ